MATTKIWSIRGRVESVINYAKDHEKTENPRYTNAQIQALEDVIEYAANEDKTERHFFVSGINCNETCAKKQFENVKRRFDKTDGIIAFHAYQSFAEDETTPAEAHRIGQKLAQELWGDRFQVLVATHTNSHCLHNHMVINSVSFKDGKKFHADSKFYRRMKETSDRICMEHGLSVVENPGRGSERVYEAKMSDAGKATRYNLARMAVDEAISKSHNIKEFELQMRKQGYSVQLSQNRKYWTVKPFDIRFCKYSMKCVLVLLAAYTMGIIIYASSQGNYRRGIEHGSAKWAITERVAKRYANKREPLNAKILTQNVQLSYNAMEHRRNMHVMVVGGSGSGKTRFFAKPNLLQSNTSFVVLDPKGADYKGQIIIHF